MIEVKTESGFVCTVSSSLKDDMELVDILAGEYSNEAYRNSALVRHILGDQKKALYDHVRKTHGMVSVTAVNKELVDIFAALGEQGKNS